MVTVNRVRVPVVADTRGYRREVLAFLKELEASLKLVISLSLDDGGLTEQFRKAREKTQGEADKTPVKVPTKIDPLDASWRRRLEKELDQATAGLEAAIPATVEGEKMRADLRKQLDEAKAGLSAKIPTSPEEAADFRRKTDALVKKVSNRHAEIKADADTAVAQAQLALAARDRRVEITAAVSKRSLASVTTFLSAVSGARVAGDAVQSLGEKFQNLDRAVPRIAGVATAIGSLGSVALSSVGGIFSVGASLAPLAALAAPLPGLLLAGGAAIAVFSAAMVDAKTQLGSLGPQFTALQDDISSSFWAQAKQPILDLVNGVFPALEEGLGHVATSLGKWSASVAGSFQAAFSDEVIGNITGALSTGITNSIRGTDAFAASIAALGGFSAQYLPRIGTAFSDLALSFNGWIQGVTSDGRLSAWVESGMAVLGQLGQVVTNVFGIFGNVASAAFAAGGSGLQGLVGALQTINQVTSTPLFQGALTTIFEGAAAGAASLGRALGPIGSLVEGLSTPISAALSGLSLGASNLLTGIADALNTPIVATGIQDAVAGILAGIDGLLPSLPALGSLLGTALSAFGQLAGVIGPVLGAALQAVAPLFSSLLDALMPIAAIAGPLLVSAIQLLAPLFTQLAGVLTPIATALLPVVGAVFAALGPIISTLVAAIAPLVTAILPLLSAVLGAIMPIIQALVPIISALLPPILQVATLIATVLTAAFQGLTPIITTVVSAVVPIIQGLADIVTSVVDVISGLLTGNWAQVWKGAQGIVTGISSVISSTISGLLNIITGRVNGGLNIVRDTFQRVFSALGNVVLDAVHSVGSAISGLRDVVVGAVSGAGQWLAGAGKAIIDGLISGIRGAIGGVKDLLNSVTGLIPDWKGPPSTDAKLLVNNGRLIMGGLITGINDRTGDLRSTLQGITTQIPQYQMRRSLLTDADAQSAAVGGMPDQITLVDQDGSILARTRVIADDAVGRGTVQTAQQLTTGLNRRYA
jgi:phage-related protein